MTTPSIYKQIFDSQNGKCVKCGNEIPSLKEARFLISFTPYGPTKAVCNECKDKKILEQRKKAEEEEIEKRRKERENWLDPNNPNYETRLRCQREGHKVLEAYQGFRGGGCWCGYYSPKERPLSTRERDDR